METYRSGHNGAHSKCVCRVTGTWVRIPPSPPFKNWASQRVNRHKVCRDSGGSKERNLPPIYHQKRQALKMCPKYKDRTRCPVFFLVSFIPHYRYFPICRLCFLTRQVPQTFTSYFNCSFKAVGHMFIVMNVSISKPIGTHILVCYSFLEPHFKILVFLTDQVSVLLI